MDRKKRKCAKGRGKGPKFERKMSEMLSLWWTNGKHDDYFWRTAGSGSRATVRGRRGVRTRNSAGDLMAVVEQGKPLLDVMVFSLKNGYAKHHAMTAFDRPKENIDLEFDKWITEIEECHENCGSFSWAIIHQRTRRAAVIYFPLNLFNQIKNQVEYADLKPLLRLDKYNQPLFAMRLDVFLREVTPEAIQRIHKRV